MADRRLRPRWIVPTADGVWLVDESRPAAAVVSPEGAVRLVHWQASEHDAPCGGDRRVLARGSGIVVQDGASVTWVDVDGMVARATCASELVAADDEIAWFTDGGEINYEIPGMGWAFDPAAHDGTGRIHALRADGEQHSFELPAPVRDIRLDGSDVVLVLAQQPVCLPSGRMRYPSAELPVPRSTLLTEGVDGIAASAARSATGHGATDDDPLEDDTGDERWVWLASSPAQVLRTGERAGAVVWWAGNDRAGDQVHRRVVVLGHEADTGRPAVRIDAGPGIVSTAAAVGAEFWVAVARQRVHFASQARGVEVIAFSSSGQRTVYAPDSIDISITDPPLVVRPTDDEIEHAVDAVRTDLRRLTTIVPRRRWPSRSRRHRFRDVRTTVEGEWPSTTVVLTFRHHVRRRLVLRRTFAVFDEQGRPIGPRDRAGNLEEDMTSGYVSPRDEAVDGVLDT